MIRAEVSQVEPTWLFLLSTSHSSFLSAMVCIMFEQTICVLRVFPGREKVNGNQKTFPTGLRQEPDNKRSEFNFVRFLNVLLNSDVFSYQNVDKLCTKKTSKRPFPSSSFWQIYCTFLGKSWHLQFSMVLCYMVKCSLDMARNSIFVVDWIT